MKLLVDETTGSLLYHQKLDLQFLQCDRQLAELTVVAGDRLIDQDTTLDKTVKRSKISSGSLRPGRNDEKHSSNSMSASFAR